MIVGAGALAALYLVANNDRRKVRLAYVACAAVHVLFAVWWSRDPGRNLIVGAGLAAAAWYVVWGVM